MNQTVIQQALKTMHTPFYVFDTDASAAKMLRLREMLPERVKLCYAMKANPFLIRDLERATDYFEVCSPGEFRICERSGVSMDKVVLSGVYKNPDDVDYVMERYGSRITYTAESLTQWTLIADAAQRLKKQVRVLLRLSNGSQFGMDLDDIKAILHGGHSFARAEGIHYFTGTQKKSPKRIEKELAHLDDVLDELERDCGWRAQLLEYGPGLPVCYFEGEKDPAPEMEQALCAALEQMRYQGAVTLEMGRYFAACSGSYVTRIVDVKTNCGNDYCIVDGGIHQVNYYGQMLATKRPPVTMLPERRGEETSPYTVCGALCTTNDILLKEFPMPEPQLGDALVFDRVGAYSPLEGIALFLSRDLPQVALYSEQDGLRLVREAVPTDPCNGER